MVPLSTVPEPTVHVVWSERDECESTADVCVQKILALDARCSFLVWKALDLPHKPCVCGSLIGVAPRRVAGGQLWV